MRKALVNYVCKHAMSVITMKVMFLCQLIACVRSMLLSMLSLTYQDPVEVYMRVSSMARMCHPLSQPLNQFDSEVTETGHVFPLCLNFETLHADPHTNMVAYPECYPLTRTWSCMSMRSPFFWFSSSFAFSFLSTLQKHPPIHDTTTWRSHPSSTSSRKELFFPSSFWPAKLDKYGPCHRNYLIIIQCSHSRFLHSKRPPFFCFLFS